VLEEKVSKKLVALGEKSLSKTLLAGLGGSLVFHASVASAIGYFWRPTDQLVEVTLVEPVAETTPPPTVQPIPTPPTVKPSQKPVVPKKVVIAKLPLPTVLPTPTVKPTPPIVKQVRTRPPEIAQVTPPPTRVKEIVTRLPVEQPSPKAVTSKKTDPTDNPKELVANNSRKDLKNSDTILNSQPNRQELSSNRSRSSGSIASQNDNQLNDSRNQVAMNGHISGSTKNIKRGIASSSGVNPAEESTNLSSSGTPGNAGAIAAVSGTVGGSGNQGSLGNAGSSTNSTVGQGIASSGGVNLAEEPTNLGSSGTPGNAGAIAAVSGTVGGSSNQGSLGNAGSSANSIVGQGIASSGGVNPAEESTNLGSSGTPGNAAAIAMGVGSVPGSGNNQSSLVGGNRSWTAANFGTGNAESSLGADDNAGAGSSNLPGNNRGITNPNGLGGSPGNNQGNIALGNRGTTGLGGYLRQSPGSGQENSESPDNLQPGNSGNIARGGNSLGPPANGNSTALASGDQRSSKVGNGLGNSPASLGGDDNVAAGLPAQRQAAKPEARCIRNCEMEVLKLADSAPNRSKVQIKVKVDKNGLVLQARVHATSGDRNIDEKLRVATERMEFAPTGKPESYTITHNINAINTTY
jgi:hypothetical protein